MKEYKTPSRNSWTVSLVATLTLVMAATSDARAQQPSVRAYADPPEVAVGERFRVIVEVSGVNRLESIATPEPFEFGQYRSRPVLSVKVPGGDAAGSPNSVTLTYVLDAREAGLFEVDPFRIIADGRTLETEPLAILVTREGGAEVEVRARITPSRVHVGEEFRLTAEIVGGPMENHEFIPPELFDIVDRMGPAGYLSATEWSWSARAAEEGEFTIPPVKVVDGDRTYESQPLTLVVGPPRVRVEAGLGSESIWVGGEFDFNLEVRGVTALDEEPATPLSEDVAELLDVEESSFDMDVGQVSRRYSFRALRAGRFEIGPIRIAANGQTFETQPVSLVVDEVPTGDADPPDDLLFTGVPGKTFAYVNEPVVVEYVVLHRDRREGFGIWPVIGTRSWPSFEGFDVSEINGGWGEREVVVDGRRYERYLQRRVALRPLGAGQVNLGAATLEANVHNRSPFGRDEMSVILTSEPHTLEVLPLPEEGRPTSFRGHVGTLQTVSWLDRTRAEVGEAVTLQVEVSVEGLVEAHPAPEIDLPGGFEVSDPEIETNYPRRGNGLRGTRTYTYHLTATTPGTYMIPAVEMSYFDPETESYGTTRTHPFTITVVPAGAEAR